MCVVGKSKAMSSLSSVDKLTGLLYFQSGILYLETEFAEVSLGYFRKLSPAFYKN
jgi:hypothetical protein